MYGTGIVQENKKSFQKIMSPAQKSRLHLYIFFRKGLDSYVQTVVLTLLDRLSCVTCRHQGIVCPKS
jgi:hypothetical protein